MNGRREFLKGCGRACFAAAGLSLLLESCAPVKNVTASSRDRIITLPLTEFGNTAKEFYRPIIVRTIETQTPILVYKRKDGMYTSILLQCSHQGAELSVNGDILTCPAHGSEFDNEGNVIQGPAEQNLITYPVTSDAKNIYIHLA